MGTKSLLSWISDVFFEDDTREIKHIDQEVEQAVNAIQAAKFDSLKGEAVLGHSSAESGETFYILDLAPIYEMVGGRDGRIGAGVVESCQRVFAHFATSPADRGTFQDEFFMMLFADNDEQACFQRAVIIVNEIGKFVLSDRFEEMEVPEMLVAIKAKDITNRDGSINLARMEETVMRGGELIPMERPAKDAPHWVKMMYKKKQAEYEMVEVDHEAHEDDLTWQYAKPEHETALAPRSMMDRRRVKMALTGADRRKTFDRRGRGYSRR